LSGVLDSQSGAALASPWPGCRADPIADSLLGPDRSLSLLEPVGEAV